MVWGWDLEGALTVDGRFGSTLKRLSHVFCPLPDRWTALSACAVLSEATLVLLSIE